MLAVSGIFAVSGVALASTPIVGRSAQSGLGAPPPRFTYLTNLVTPGYYVGQYNFVECVGASIQMMRNMVMDTSNHSSATQHTLWAVSHYLSKYKADNGADPYGWAATLGREGAGPYRIDAGATVLDTLQAAATAMTLSGRPAGVTVWQGSHAWVLSGITTTADAGGSAPFSVVRVEVTDPLWTILHHGGGILAPSTWLSVAQFAKDFLPYHDPRRDPAIEGRYVAIVPVPTAAELDHLGTGSTFTFGPG